MKKLGLLSVLASALMLCFTVSCDQLEDILGGGDKDSEEAFFPSAYADKEVAAWYKLTVKEDNKTKIEAVYLFTDNSLVVTKHKVYSKDDGRSPERSITAEGTYQITEGDYTTGKASVILSDGQSFEVTIEDGMLFAMGESFSIQDNSKVPTPKQPVESGDNGGGNNNGGGDNYSEEAFFPSAYADKNVAAWYMLTAKRDNKTRIEAVYLFTDNTLVVTKHNIYTKEDGRSPERSITAEGSYRITEGDYTTGKASVILSDGTSFEVTIENGMLFAMGESFSIQDNEKVPTPKQPSGKDQGGNNQGGNQGGEGDGIEAFFPKDCAGKSVYAWYSYSDTIFYDGYDIKYIASIYFFEDHTYVSTVNSIVTSHDFNRQECKVSQTGTYELVEGDFSTKDYKIKLIPSAGKSVTVEVSNGKFKEVDVESGEERIFTIQNNNNIPAPSEPTNNQGENNQGGNNQEDCDVPAFLPTSYADKTVVAWYSYSVSDAAGTRVEAVFLFGDNTLIRTERKIPSMDNMSEERYIWYRGSYAFIGDVDYDYGSADVDLTYPEERKINITVTDGELVWEYDKEKVFKRRDLNDVPDVLDPSFDDDDQGGDDNGGDDNGGDDNGDDNGGEGQSDVKLVAWYTKTFSDNYQVAIILLDDYTIAITQTYIPDVSGIVYPAENVGKGSYKLLEGDYTNGVIRVNIFEDIAEYRISNGEMTGDDGIFDEGSFTKQDNSAYTGPTEFDYDDDDDDDGEDDISQVKAYLPSEYADRTVSAWYMSGYQDDSIARLEAVFLFSDGTLSVTKSMYYIQSVGKKPEFSETTKGTYRIKDGDFNNGKADVNSKDGSFEVVIEFGIMTVMETVFERMSNDDLAEMTTSGNSK